MNKSKKIFIIYERYFDFDNMRIVSGGVQTYLTNLIPLFVGRGYDVKLYQCGERNNTVSLEYCDVIAIKDTIVNGKYRVKKMVSKTLKDLDNENDVLLFADHCCTGKNSAKHCIAIQHGISWDIPRKNRFNDLFMAGFSAYKTYQEHRKLKYVNNLICVDYNFPNWYKAQVDEPKCKLTIVPNFTKILNRKEVETDNDIKIIFARRFVQHRGTRVFATAINRILEEYMNVTVTVAGRGPDESYLHDNLDKWGDRIKFIQYVSDESIRIHKNHDIALVPTVGSEGTSLSLLEAMSASCAVICTSVGGMTNIILNGYNGLMVEPGNATELYEAIKYLIDNPDKRKSLATCGYDTVVNAFNYDRWRAQWISIIDAL